MARDAPCHTDHFSFIHLDTGVNVDFWRVGPRAYDREGFARRTAPEPTRPLFVVLAPEDVILSKLQWMRMGAGERHETDIRSILRLQGSNLDLEYLRRWAVQLDVSGEPEALLSGVEAWDPERRGIG